MSKEVIYCAGAVRGGERQVFLFGWCGGLREICVRGFFSL